MDLHTPYSSVSFRMTLSELMTCSIARSISDSLAFYFVWSQRTRPNIGLSDHWVQS